MAGSFASASAFVSALRQRPKLSQGLKCLHSETPPRPAPHRPVRSPGSGKGHRADPEGHRGGAVASEALDYTDSWLLRQSSAWHYSRLWDRRRFTLDDRVMEG